MPTINEMIDFCEEFAAYDCFSNEQFARREMFYAISDELKKALREQKRPLGECKIYHAMFEDRIACKCGFMQVITGHWDDYNYCQRCGRKALKEGDEK